MDITGSTAIVTGGASGIGAAAARQLAAKGATVVIADLQADKGEALAEEIKGVFAQVDVTNTDQIKAAVDAATAIAPLRAVVNSAGIGWAQRTIGRDGEFDSAHDLEAYRKVIAINLIGTFDVTRLAATAMSRNEPDADGCRGAIANLTSVAAFDGQIGQAAYSSSKGGVVGMTLPVARDLSSAGIRLNTIAPGLIDTPIYGEGEQAEAFKAKLGESVLFPKRLGEPEELASMVVETIINSYMNAEVIRVDGGIRMPPKCAPERAPWRPLRGTTHVRGPSQVDDQVRPLGGRLDQRRVRVVHGPHPGLGLVRALAERHVPVHQARSAQRRIDAQVPHRVQLGPHRLPPRLVEQQVVALGHDDRRRSRHRQRAGDRLLQVALEARSHHQRLAAAHAGQQGGVPLGVEGLRRPLAIQQPAPRELDVGDVEAVHRHHDRAPRRRQPRRERRLPDARSAGQPEQPPVEAGTQRVEIHLLRLPEQAGLNPFAAALEQTYSGGI
jgi:NAD(P)-dependent dehydrogenase (short-subunit alcohol dehydrogenase family)